MYIYIAHISTRYFTSWSSWTISHAMCDMWYEHVQLWNISSAARPVGVALRIKICIMYSSGCAHSAHFLTLNNSQNDGYHLHIPSMDSKRWFASSNEEYGHFHYAELQITAGHWPLCAYQCWAHHSPPPPPPVWGKVWGRVGIRQNQKSNAHHWGNTKGQIPTLPPPMQG